MRTTGRSRPAAGPRARGQTYLYGTPQCVHGRTATRHFSIRSSAASRDVHTQAILYAPSRSLRQCLSFCTSRM